MCTTLSIGAEWTITLTYFWLQVYVCTSYNRTLQVDVTYVFFFTPLYFRLQGNPACANNSLLDFCGSESEDIIDIPTNNPLGCSGPICPPSYECYSAKCPSSCLCSAPLLIGYRLKSPGFSRFSPYQHMFEEYLTSGLKVHLEQLDIGSAVWEKGPRLRMSLKVFPLYVADSNSSHMFNDSEVLRIVYKFTNWKIQDSDIFGPYELLSLTISDVYKKG